MCDRIPSTIKTEGKSVAILTRQGNANFRKKSSLAHFLSGVGIKTFLNARQPTVWGTFHIMCELELHFPAGFCFVFFFVLVFTP